MIRNVTTPRQKWVSKQRSYNGLEFQIPQGQTTTIYAYTAKRIDDVSVESGDKVGKCKFMICCCWKIHPFWRWKWKRKQIRQLFKNCKQWYRLHKSIISVSVSVGLEKMRVNLTLKIIDCAINTDEAWGKLDKSRCWCWTKTIRIGRLCGRTAMGQRGSCRHSFYRLTTGPRWSGTSQIFTTKIE